MAVQRITPTEAKALLDQGYTYLDVRSVPEYDQGHPDGAKNAPLMHAGPGGMQPNPEFVAVVQANFATDARLVIGCKSGQRSQRAAMMLEGAGFTNLVEMRGGWGGEPSTPGWLQLGLPGSTAATPGGTWEQLKAGSR